MKATGIVRRIDDLGRVVIPKEIRRTMRIREGDPLEIYTDREGEVIFKKYSPVGEMSGFAAQYAETLYKTCNLEVLICDRDAIIAVAGLPKKEYMDRSLSSSLDEIMQGRGIYRNAPEGEKIYAVDGSEERYISTAMPIVSAGDVIGCVMALSDEQKDKRRDALACDIEAKLISTAAAFLGKQIEE